MMDLNHFAAATLETPNAARYKSALAKHFAHKITVEESETQANFTFEIGTGQAIASTSELRLSAGAPTPSELDGVKDVLERHLKIFAAKEAIAPLDWTQTAAPD